MSTFTHYDTPYMVYNPNSHTCNTVRY